MLRALRSVLVVLGTAGAAQTAGAASLPPMGADPAGSTVSGLSSGAFMAVQLQVAFSGTFQGAGVVAGGPYHCSEGEADLALHRCMATSEGAPDPERLVAVARERAASGAIDPLDNLARAKVYIFGGSVDPVVTPPVIQALERFYLVAGVPPASLVAKTDIAAGHAFATLGYGGPCDKTAAPFINSCGFDLAGAILGHLYGPLAAAAPSPQGELITFDQAEFLADPMPHGLDTEGFLYLPPACAGEGRCRVHVALHGCLQGRERLGSLYATATGYNRWADTNRLLILYPQAVTTRTNPQGCWDWFAYDDPNFDLKSGRQMAAVKGMLDRLLAAP